MAHVRATWPAKHWRKSVPDMRDEELQAIRQRLEMRERALGVNSQIPADLRALLEEVDRLAEEMSAQNALVDDLVQKLGDAQARLAAAEAVIGIAERLHKCLVAPGQGGVLYGTADLGAALADYRAAAPPEVAEEARSVVHYWSQSSSRSTACGQLIGTGNRIAADAEHVTCKACKATWPLAEGAEEDAEHVGPNEFPLLAAALKRNAVAVARAKAEPQCQLCGYPEGMTHHRDSNAKGFHPFVARDAAAAPRPEEAGE